MTVIRMKENIILFYFKFTHFKLSMSENKMGVRITKCTVGEKIMFHFFHSLSEACTYSYELITFAEPACPKV